MTEAVNETDYEIDGAKSAALTDHVLTNIHAAIDAELNILFIGPKPMEGLCIYWLDLPGPTDVMSFPTDELRPGIADRPTPAGTLGDIRICPQVAEQRAEGAGHTIMEEVLMLATHGMFYLLSYDHAEGDGKKEMLALQRTLLLTSLATQ